MAEKLNLNDVIVQVCKEKNIEKEVLVDALERAMMTAARKKLGLTADLEAHFNEEMGEVEIFEFKTIVKEVLNPSLQISLEQAVEFDPDVSEEALGDDIGVKVDSNKLGRIAAQTAKQVIVQRVRDAERNTVYNDFKDRKGDLLTGILRRFERGNMIVDLGRAEAILPYKEQIPRENIRAGDRVVAYVLDVLEASRGPQIVLSRATAQFVVRLFEQEVPEFAEGIVSIESAAREAGVRTKIAVRSKDGDIDPVGACVGPKGARVQAVVEELRGEKIDIVPWDEDEVRFVCNALQPAEVSSVLLDEANHTMKIVVPDEQLSLAIGRRGQNVRLAAQLTDWKIDITSETKVSEEKDIAFNALNKVEGLSEILVQTLYNHGFRTVVDLLDAEDEFLASVPGFSDEAIPRVRDAAQKVLDDESKIEERKHEDARLLAHRFQMLETSSETNFSKYEKELPISGFKSVFPYLAEMLKQAGYICPEDLCLADEMNRLVEIFELPLAKAKQIRMEAEAFVQATLKDFNLISELEISEKEEKEIAEFDAANSERDPSEVNQVTSEEKEMEIAS